MRFPAWTEQAACAGKPTEWWTPEEGSRKGKLPPIARRALALCAACPVQVECLADAILNERYEFTIRAAPAAPWVQDGGYSETVTHELEGIRGGTTWEDRKATKGIADQAERAKALLEISRSRARRLGLVKEESRV